jgi:23S rRNA pseudouridine1911/1915/1917 synthase
MRLDAYLQLQYPRYSRSLIQKMIENGHVLVDGETEIKSRRNIKDTNSVILDDSRLHAALPDIDVKVIYEDADCVVIDKPLGVLTHSKGAFNPEATVASWLKTRSNYNFPADAERGGIVHRLDRGTSGVIICAKNKVALGKLQKQFQVRKAKKIYVARVVGIPDPAHAQLDLPLERNPKLPQTFRVGPNGKDAQTEYRVIQKFNSGQALVELKPRTGRTHQLRVHMAYIKCPIVGDRIYGGPDADRIYLHAAELEITLPSSERMTFVSPLPLGFKKEIL